MERKSRQAEGRKLAGASLVRLPGQAASGHEPDVPPATTPLVAAQRHPGVPARQAGRHRAATIGQQDEPVTSTGAGGRHRPAAPGHAVTTAPGDDLIIGIADAASYLGYDKPESFRRARTRNPIPGESKTEDGRPCWTPAALRSWQSKRRIAGNRAPAGEPD